MNVRLCFVQGVNVKWESNPLPPAAAAAIPEKPDEDAFSLRFRDQIPAPRKTPVDFYLSSSSVAQFSDWIRMSSARSSADRALVCLRSSATHARSFVRA